MSRSAARAPRSPVAFQPDAARRSAPTPALVLLARRPRIHLLAPRAQGSRERRDLPNALLGANEVPGI
jgi:hypothetical protein